MVRSYLFGKNSIIINYTIFSLSHEMLIVLPNKKEGLPDVLKRLGEQPDWFKEIFTSNQYFSDEVILRMPKFILGGESIQLKEALSNMGLQSIFSEQTADLSGITGDKSLTVSDVHHQAIIEVGWILLLNVDLSTP